jgi:hypothetical protein
MYGQPFAGHMTPEVTGTSAERHIERHEQM